ncbi:MAG: hypothetical protein HYV04_06290 [Deltaproteobacteria bacterium]|nr:hypothetical protein [Deltaproteobacteria bacterium]
MPSVMRHPGPILSFPSKVANDENTFPSEVIGFDSRAALVVGHPGHELCVYGWLQVACPQVFVLTDGSGRSGLSRLGSTTRILSQTNAKVGSIYGRFSDQAVYGAILDGDYELFLRLSEELADEFVGGQIHYVAGDAMEGYNPTHDVCRLVLNTAVEMAQRSGHRIANFDFLLAGSLNPSFREAQGNRAIWVELDDTTFASKLAAANAYSELTPEVKTAIAQKGMDSFRIECLRPASCNTLEKTFWKKAPFYEQYGERQVAAGYYQKIIRYREHVLPLSEALRGQISRRR